MQIRHTLQRMKDAVLDGDAIDKAMYDLHQTGMTKADIARQYNVTPQRVGKRIERYMIRHKVK